MPVPIPHTMQPLTPALINNAHSQNPHYVSSNSHWPQTQHSHTKRQVERSVHCAPFASLITVTHTVRSIHYAPSVFHNVTMCTDAQHLSVKPFQYTATRTVHFIRFALHHSLNSTHTHSFTVPSTAFLSPHHLHTQQQMRTARPVEKIIHL